MRTTTANVSGSANRRATEQANCRLYPGERALLEAAAAREGKTLSSWMRRTLVAAAAFQTRTTEERQR